MNTKLRVTLLIFISYILSDSHSYRWPPPNVYMTTWDKVNLDEVLACKKLLHHYFTCLMGQGPCPPDGRELKKILPEALRNACAKCSKSQEEGAIKIIKYLRKYEPKKFETLANKYDPKGIYRCRYLATNCDTSTL
ncbi:ejaculatory bulb-specific protein 3-like [Chelonus insularis]|uniref:ejaculatory bulb-specific protein 3-like n=1 Tax=Chelonus insularis TaxID=460826 RepID=UPI00158DD146|nr:ejaculatory bulb-specific protein 3-like [Chelonus insularis]